MDPCILRQKLAQKGFKMTQPRQKILEALLRESGWVTAKFLHDELTTHKTKIDFSTVCRNLDSLCKMEVLCRVDRENNGVFAYSLREIQEHHHHLICRSCGKISPMDFCPMQQLKSSQTEGYSELECHFEIYGNCHDCQVK
jgi:Fe2+ or Zn2+ uptake regulation protein